MSRKIVNMQLIKIILFMVIVLLVAILLAKYLTNEEFRDSFNTKLFHREVVQSSLKTLEVDAENNANIYTFDEYIAIFQKNNIKIYNSNAEEIYSSDISLNNPIEISKGKYMIIAENTGNRIVLIDKLGIKWENTIIGEIYKININSNGYATVISQDSTYESIITVFDKDGKELYKKFLANGYAISAELADNNEYLAIGKVDYSGAIIKSTIELVSTKASKNEDILNTFEAESGDILVNMKFNSKNELISVFDSYVEKITDSSLEKIYDIDENDIFIDVNLKDNIIIAQKENSGLFSYDYQLVFKNTIGKSDSLYILEKDIPKKIITANKICCVRFANEIRLINSNGWLLKKYNTTKDIKDILVADKIVAVIYNNKIEIIST